MSLILNGTTGLSDVDGSASTPAIRGTDTNTGIFFPAADTIAFAEGGAEVARIDSNGNLGIGTTTPVAKLDVRGILAIANSNASYWALDRNDSDGALTFTDTSTERMRIDSSGNLGIGGTPTCILDVLSASNQNVNLFRIFSSQYSVNTLQARAVAANSASSTNAALYVGQNSGTSRSINAGGTINASGADYAEYMTKAGSFTINKGDICGIDADGKLTNVFANSISFVVKSTAPSYVGGDSWFTEQEPTEQSEMAEWEARMEAARQTVDRIAFSGQVPVNVTGATAGQYIIPVNDNGAIKGEAVSNPTFEQYQIAVGKVIAIEQDGRAKIIVKVA